MRLPGRFSQLGVIANIALPPGSHGNEADRPPPATSGTKRRSGRTFGMPVLRVIENSRPGRPPAVMLDGVSIRYGGNGAPVYEAVRAVSLRVAESEFVAIVGPTGLRQVHLAQRGGWPAAPCTGAVYGLRRAARRAQRQGGLPVPAGRPDAVEDGAATTSPSRLEVGGHARAPRRWNGRRPGWSAWGWPAFARPLSASALGRAAQARRRSRRC